LLTNMDVLVAKYLLGPDSAGIYMAGNRLVQASLAGIPVLSNVFIPALVARNKRGESGNPKRLSWAIAAISIASCAVFLIGANVLPKWLFGPRFSSLSQIFPTLGLVVGLRYLSSIDGFQLSVREQQVSRAIVHSTLAILTLIVAFGFSLFYSFGESQLALLVATVCAAQIAAYRFTVSRPNSEVV